MKIVEATGGSITSTKQFVWASGAMKEGRDASGNVLSKYFTTGQTLSGTSYFYNKDVLGSIREMTDSSANIQAQSNYDPFGRVSQLQGAQFSDFQYAGYYLHRPSGLALTLARAYSSSFGRWINRDPIGEAGGVNMYTYALNEPMSISDPSGLAPPPLSTPYAGEIVPLPNLLKRLGLDPDSGALNDGCIALVQLYQDQAPFHWYPEHWPNTACFLDRGKAEGYKCPCHTTPLVFGKYGPNWPSGQAPTPDPQTGQIPNNSMSYTGGNFDYLIDFGGNTFAGLNNGASKGPQYGKISHTCPANPWPNGAGMWCVTCVSSK
ncbi:MAG TPA: RHS repeat-associated core domain-containing protein [Oculatellaceae cyanobacterium]